MESILNFLNTDSETLLTSIKDIALALVLAFLIVYILNTIMKKTQKRMEARGQNTTIIRVLRYLFLTLIIFAAVSQVVSSIPSLSSFMSTLLAGSGIAAIIISVAAQEPIGNMVSGIIIIVSKPFKVGDIIRYIDKDITGVVEEITMRHTVVRTFENKRLIIPNGTINSCAIENYNYLEEKICLLMDFAITFQSDPEKAMRLISDIVLLQPEYCDNRTEEEINAGAPPVKTLIVKFTPTAVVIRAWVWAASTSASVDMKSDILLGVRRRFAEEGIEFAYPHAELVVKNDHDAGI